MSSSADSRLRNVLLAYFPMFIATLSLVTSIYNGYLNSRFVDIIQRNVGRSEYMRTCKEVIDAYFQVKLRVSALNRAGERAGGSGPEQMDAANAVARFSALATWLANLRDESIRARYTDLAMRLDKIASEAKGLPQAALDGRYAGPDQLFGELNDDCIKAAKE
ncbi:MAG: hypothetical protein FJX62_11125 [Alphaproteobacteria bacterium]|nr:hypothetical protein [Alphaproteobacteria bacterium]